ncbi:hypothetical protein OAQ99_06825 [Candidatus Kapabacteria bacterium]|nr:hypothetical protein [Candidatus Kapabacteria bacterium]
MKYIFINMTFIILFFINIFMVIDIFAPLNNLVEGREFQFENDRSDEVEALFFINNKYDVNMPYLYLRSNLLSENIIKQNYLFIIRSHEKKELKFSLSYSNTLYMLDKNTNNLYFKNIFEFKDQLNISDMTLISGKEMLIVNKQRNVVLASVYLVVIIINLILVYNYKSKSILSLVLSIILIFSTSYLSIKLWKGIIEFYETYTLDI